MDFISTVLFESPVWLGFACFGLFAVVLLTRNSMNETWRGRSLPGVLLLIAGLFLMQSLVTTDRERIRGTLDQFVAAITAKDAAGIGRCVADSYNEDGMDGPAFTQFVVDALKDVDIYDTRLGQRDVTVDGDAATMKLGANATVRIRGGAGEFHVGYWNLRWVRQGDDWRIAGIQPVTIDTIPFHSLREVRGQIR